MDPLPALAIAILPFNFSSCSLPRSRSSLSHLSGVTNVSQTELNPIVNAVHVALLLYLVRLRHIVLSLRLGSTFAGACRADKFYPFFTLRPRLRLTQDPSEKLRVVTQVFSAVLWHWRQYSNPLFSTSPSSTLLERLNRPRSSAKL